MHTILIILNIVRPFKCRSASSCIDDLSFLLYIHSAAGALFIQLVQLFSFPYQSEPSPIKEETCRPFSPIMKASVGTMLLVAVLAILGGWSCVQVQAACLCNVSSNGEYCGTELNRRNGNNDCARDQYLCGPSNRGKEAIVVKKCARGFECDVSRNGASK